MRQASRTDHKWTIEPGDRVRLPVGDGVDYLEVMVAKDGQGLRVVCGEGRLQVLPDSANVVLLRREL